MKDVKKYIFLIPLLIFLLGFNACTSHTETKEKMLQTEGLLKLGIDESIRPVMTEVVKVYDSSFPKVEVQETYDFENTLMEKLMNDEYKIIVITRDATEQEQAYATQNRFRLKTLAVAKDAIAVIGHPDNEDQEMTLSQLSNILKGTFARQYNVVVNTNKGSVANYLRRELLEGEDWGEHVYSQESYEGIIDYVNNHPNTIGFLPVNYLYGEESNEQHPFFREDITAVPLYNDSVQKFILPYQAFIALDEYPLNRSIYFINRDNRQVPSSGFANFLAAEPAQLLFKKSLLVPLRSQLIIRPVEIK